MTTEAVPCATRIFAMRHGETAWNVGTRIQGHIDIGLNERGLWQAERLGEALSAEALSAVYSSDLKRAADTAAAIGKRCGLPVRLDAGLRERSFGVFEGLTWAEIETRWPGDSTRWRARDPDFAPSGGESLSVFSARVLAACHRIAAAHPGKCIAWVAHGGVMDCLHRAATHVGLWVPRTWRLGNATVNRLLYTGEGFSLVGWDDASHLSGTGTAPIDDASVDASTHQGADRAVDRSA